MIPESGNITKHVKYKLCFQTLPMETISIESQTCESVARKNSSLFVSLLQVQQVSDYALCPQRPHQSNCKTEDVQASPVLAFETCISARWNDSTMPFQTFQTFHHICRKRSLEYTEPFSQLACGLQQLMRLCIQLIQGLPCIQESKLHPDRNLSRTLLPIGNVQARNFSKHFRYTEISEVLIVSSRRCDG